MNFAVEGTLEDWKEFAKLARDNPRLRLPIAAAFAPPVCKFLYRKQLPLLCVDPLNNCNDILWHATETVWGRRSYGETVLLHGGIEVNLPRLSGYNAQLKESLKPDDRWRVSDLFQWQQSEESRELRSTAVLFAIDENMYPLDLEEDTCLVSIPPNHDESWVSHGIFQNLHGGANLEAFINDLVKLTEVNRGTAWKAFLKAFQSAKKEDENELRVWLERRIRSYLKFVNQAEPGKRGSPKVQERVATIYAAARFAMEHSILPWSVGGLRHSLFTCVVENEQSKKILFASPLQTC